MLQNDSKILMTIREEMLPEVLTPHDIFNFRMWPRVRLDLSNSKQEANLSLG